MQSFSTAFVCTLLGIVSIVLYIIIQGPIGMAIFFYGVIPFFVISIVQTIYLLVKHSRQ